MGRKITQEQAVAAYAQTGSTRKAGALLGVSGVTVFHHLRRAGVTMDRWRVGVEKRGPDECWPFTGKLNSNGYSRRHREVYEEAHGPIPSGLEVDHICENKACLNPAHLRLLTHAENARRSMPARGKRGRFLPRRSRG